MKFLFSILFIGLLGSSLYAGSFGRMFAEGEQDSQVLGDNVKTTIEGVIESLAEQFIASKKIKNLTAEDRIIITPFVELKNFKNTTEFGRVIGESLIHELSFRGLNVVEFRAQTAVSIDGKGEYFMSRDLGKIRQKIENKYILVGTYSRLEYKILVNARIIDNIDGTIIATARTVYDHGLRDDCKIFNECKPPRTINLVPGN
jgi:TolB-like protein